MLKEANRRTWTSPSGRTPIAQQRAGEYYEGRPQGTWLQHEDQDHQRDNYFTIIGNRTTPLDTAGRNWYEATRIRTILPAASGGEASCDEQGNFANIDEPELNKEIASSARTARVRTGKAYAGLDKKYMELRPWRSTAAGRVHVRRGDINLET